MPENSSRKPPTNFTIDCILSKNEAQLGDQQRSPTTIHPMNKVLDNPWISKFPLELTFKPLPRKLHLPPSPTATNFTPNYLNLYNPLINSNDILRVTQHFTSVHNHFYSSTTTTSTSDNETIPDSINLSPKFNVYDKCDNENSSNELSLNLSDKCIVKQEFPSTVPIAIFKCSICSKNFISNELLDVHEKCHLKPKYECSECNKKFSQLRNFKYHMSIHRGTKEFAANCPECGKTFNDKGYLSSHLKIHRTHSGEKPYKCSQPGCEKRFADRSNMILHNRLHSGVKPFACTLCPKRFSKKHHLGTHMNYHTGNKPYICINTGCGQRFTQSSNMRTHAKKCQYRST
ncbi:CLUMA_CG014387, isoform A [Clunio marinus]|uniref:CLUMA_CG014387, isoform A n=1 Tax=Clunio marinus TaxID=568069 RepID=A0A1J1IMN4_9DIPT|nr:CLUMA_CG014387, isoform A [Clunio marinus]